MTGSTAWALMTRRQRWIMKPRDTRERLAAYYMVTAPTLVWLLIFVSPRFTVLVVVLIETAVFAVMFTAFVLWYRRRTPATATPPPVSMPSADVPAS